MIDKELINVNKMKMRAKKSYTIIENNFLVIIISIRVMVTFQNPFDVVVADLFVGNFVDFVMKYWAYAEPGS